MATLLGMFALGPVEMLVLALVAGFVLWDVFFRRPPSPPAV